MQKAIAKSVQSKIYDNDSNGTKGISNMKVCIASQQGARSAGPNRSILGCAGNRLRPMQISGSATERQIETDRQTERQNKRDRAREAETDRERERERDSGNDRMGMQAHGAILI